MKLWNTQCRTGVVVLALALGLTGCGDSSKRGEPKADPNAPKLEQKTPGGAPGSGGVPGKNHNKPTGGAE
jgi:hypothetical protein